MIIGIGSDLVDIRRIDKLSARFPDKFRQRILNDSEQQLMEQHKTHPNYRLAKYFAAKEAAWKALGEPRSHGIGWHDFEIGYAASGKPELILKDKALLVLKSKISKGMEAAIHLSLSDEYPYAQAFVVIEANRLII